MHFNVSLVHCLKDYQQNHNCMLVCPLACQYVCPSVKLFVCPYLLASDLGDVPDMYDVMIVDTGHSDGLWAYLRGNVLLHLQT